MKTHTTLFKLELNEAGDIVAKDLTRSSSLGPWIGAAGTPLSNLPRSNKCSGTVTWDAAFMMDGTFLDYNSDGLPDLITVGQHAPVRGHLMVMDNSFPEGIRFLNTVISSVGRGIAQEYLRVTALDKQKPEFRSNCVYVSGEQSEGGDCGGGMKDHLLCYSGSAWARTNMPNSISSEMRVPEVNLEQGTRNLLINVREGTVGETVMNRPYRIRFR